MSVGQRFVERLSDLAATFKSPRPEAQPEQQTDDTGRSTGDATEERRGTSLHPSADALIVSQSGDAERRGNSQTHDEHARIPDRQHSTRTTDLRQLDGHESWRGVYDLNESEGWGHE